MKKEKIYNHTLNFFLNTFETHYIEVNFLKVDYDFTSKKT
jgi:hypothetical protein